MTSVDKRTPGRRYWETHKIISLGTAIAVTLLAGSLWFLYGRIKLLEKPHNPHYEPSHCFDCHESMGSKMTAEKCYDCHDRLTRQLLPGAVERRAKLSEQPCFHPLKLADRNNVERTPTQLCLGCHTNPKGYVAMANIRAGDYIEIDMSQTHPIGLMPGIEIYPRTLPLAENGAINCVTCHDPHGQDPRMRLLRYYYPGNGHPPDFRPLCNDCHPDGWMPLHLKRSDIIKDAK
jgi:hypothetical protein